MAQAAFLLAGGGDPELVRATVSCQFNSDAEFFTFGAMHVMALYAERLNAKFEAFMRELFGSMFEGAPVKHVSRMKLKLASDLAERGEWDLLQAWSDVDNESTGVSSLEADQWVRLRTMPFFHIGCDPRVDRGRRGRSDDLCSGKASHARPGRKQPLRRLAY